MTSFVKSLAGTRHWTRCSLLAAAVVIAWEGGVGILVAQDSTPDAAAPLPALSLEHVLEVTLENSYSVERESLQRQAREGELQATAGTFDPRFITAMSRARDVRTGVSANLLDGPPLEQNTTAYTVALQKIFRSGITVTPQVEVNHLAVNAVTPYSTASVRVGLTVPLLRDRGGIVTRSSETAVRRLLRSDTHAYRHTQSRALFAALTAYWRYAAAFARLEVQQASAERARDLVRETEVLVRAGERPPADLNHVEGNLAVKRAAVMDAEQVVVVARGDLGLVMGLPAEQVLQLGEPDEILPPPAQVNPRRHFSQTLVTLALRNRADLAAAGDLTAAGTVLVEAARQEARSGFDLLLSTGYNGIGQGPGYELLYSSLVSNVRGLNLSVGLQWEARLANDRGLGNVRQRSAEHDKAWLAERDLARQIAVDVEVGFESVRRSSRSVVEIADAVRLSRTTVENERAKHRLGSATLFDVILAEDNLTNARLAEVAAQLRHAIALADLRYQTATLLPSDGVLAVERLYTIPAPSAG